jgi:hypothetical protein
VSDLYQVCEWTLERPNAARCNRLRNLLVRMGYPIETQWWTDEQVVTFAKRTTH